MQKHKRPEHVPELVLDGLPEYISSSDEEDEDDQHHPQGDDSKQNQDAAATTVNQDSRDDNNVQRESMSQADYRNSLQYINNFY